MCESPRWHERLVAWCLSNLVPGCLPLPTGKDHQSFKRARWIIAWRVERLLCLKTHLEYPAKHAGCYWAAPACNECMQVRPLPGFDPLGNIGSQKEEYPPLPCQCPWDLSLSHTHARLAVGASRRVSPVFPRKTILLQKGDIHRATAKQACTKYTHYSSTEDLKPLIMQLLVVFFPYLKVNSDDNRISCCRAP